MHMRKWGIRAVLPLVAAALAGAVLTGPAEAAVTVDNQPTASWRVNGRVYATKIVGNTVFVGGQFSSAISPTGTTVARRNLAAFRLNDGTLITNWQADTAGRAVRTLDSDGSSLWVGGFYSSIGGVSRSRVAKVSVASGAVDAGFRVVVNGGVRGLDVAGGDLYIGGHFTTVDGVTRNHVAKLNATNGDLVQGFNTNTNNNVYGLVKNPVSDLLYVAGNFATVNGSNRPGLVGVSGTTGALSGVTLSATTRPTITVDVSSDGSRVFSGAGSNAVTSWRTSNGTRAWRQYGDGDIQVVHYFDGTLYFGFHDGFGGDTTVKVLAADALSGAFDPSFRPRMTSFWGVFGIDASAQGLVIGGEFTNVAGVAAGGWARFLP